MHNRVKTYYNLDHRRLASPLPKQGAERSPENNDTADAERRPCLKQGQSVHGKSHRHDEILNQSQYHKSTADVLSIVKSYTIQVRYVLSKLTEYFDLAVALWPYVLQCTSSYPTAKGTPL